METNSSISTATPEAAEKRFISPSLLYFVHLALRKWWLFAILGALAGLAGIWYASSKKIMYESRLTFAIDAGSNEGSASAALSLAAQFGFGFGSGQSMFDGDNILEILKSRRIVRRVLLSVDTVGNQISTLAERYIQLSGLRKLYDADPRTQNVHYPPGSGTKPFSYVEDSVLNNLYLGLVRDNIDVGRPDKKLSIYEIKITSPDERFSKVFTDRIIAEAGNFYTEITSRKDKETLDILEQRVASLKSNVGGSIHSRASTQDANVNPAFAASQSPLLMQQYNMQAYGEAYKEMFKTLEMARYQYLKKIPLLQIIDPADYPMRRVGKGKLQTAVLCAAVACLALAFGLWMVALFKRPAIPVD